MPQYIIHKDGAYNVFSTVVDAPIFEPALTLEELREWYQNEYGRKGMEELTARLTRATSASGTSSLIGHTLDKHIENNHAGKDGAKLSKDEFIRRFLTVQANAK